MMIVASFFILYIVAMFIATIAYKYFGTFDDEYDQSLRVFAKIFWWLALVIWFGMGLFEKFDEWSDYIVQELKKHEEFKRGGRN